MAKLVVNPEVDLSPRAGDVSLSAAELGKLELFAGLKRSPSFEKFPGSTVLRRFSAGEVICRQGDAGASAFYILTENDIAACAEHALPPLSRTNSGDSGVRRVATAFLSVDSANQPRPRGFLAGLLRGKSTALEAPEAIPNDGPTDIDYTKRQAPMHSGEVFGEMSCMTLSPRSATIVADTDCYMLEFTRNIFDQIQKDDGYRQRIDEIYRRRVLEGHLRKLELFRELSDQQLRSIRNSVELDVVDPGTVICDEGDPSDAVYIIRSGMVQVVTETNVTLAPHDICDFAALCRALLQGEKPPEAKTTEAKAARATPPQAETGKSPDAPDEPPQPPKPASPLDIMKLAKKPMEVGTPAQLIWRSLSKPVQAAVRQVADTGDFDEATQSRVIGELNELIRNREVLASKELAETFEKHEFLAPARTFPGGAKGIAKTWTELEVRVGGRLALSAVFPELVTRPKRTGPPRVVNYLSRGDIFGEMGVLLDQPRNATCVAYDHPGDDPTRKPGRVELVQIRADVFRDLIEQTPTLRQRLNDLVAGRDRQIHEIKESQPWDATGSIADSPDFQELGLIQGQKLLLIDLDRCTRCGDCVDACIGTHDDGYSRLFLDGPRFDKYLVPSACRQCLNPACLIGCPVGSIERGGNGQILIRDWCIGCNTCAKQCPYDSIQMHDIGLVPERSSAWRLSLAGSAAGPDWQSPRFHDRGWPNAPSPFLWDQETSSLLARSGKGPEIGERGELQQPLAFRLPVEIHKSQLRSAGSFRLQATSQGGGTTIWLNGKELAYEQDVKQKKKGEIEISLSADQFRSGRNTFAVCIEPPVAVGATILSLRLDAAPAAADQVEVKLVTEKPVVCDLCSTIPSRQPACVDQCPHEAAFRIDARYEFPIMQSAGVASRHRGPLK